jgi:hypothetical protein
MPYHLANGAEFYEYRHPGSGQAQGPSPESHKHWCDVLGDALDEDTFHRFWNRLGAQRGALTHPAWHPTPGEANPFPELWESYNGQRFRDPFAAEIFQRFLLHRLPNVGQYGEWLNTADHTLFPYSSCPLCRTAMDTSSHTYLVCPVVLELIRHSRVVEFTTETLSRSVWITGHHGCVL